MQDLNYRHLRYFWIVATEGHLTRAADRLGVSQSALSAQIRQLERDLGQPLFLREKRKLVLTEVGRVVLNYADSIFALGGELRASLSSGEGQKTQQLRIGAVATLSRNFQENFLRSVLQLEGVQLVLQSGSLEDLLERLSVHKLHVVLSNRPVSSEDNKPWRCRRIARQQVCLVGPPRPKGKPFRFPADLPQAELLLPGPGSDIRNAFDVLCESLGLAVRVRAQVDDMAMLRLLARDSKAVALVPSIVVQDELKSGVLEKYCVVPKVYESFYAVTTERRFQPDVLRRLLAYRPDL